MQNYRKVEKLSKKFIHFVYMDHKDYIADSLFIQEKCEAHFLDEYEKKGTDWIIVHMKVLKSDVDRFKRAMGRFRDVALLKGYKDYDEALEKYWKPFLEKGESSAEV